MAKKNFVWLRQGDVVLESAKSFLGNLKRVREAVLAEGEVTGHLHKVRGELMFADLGGDVKELEVLGQSAVLEHPEHDTLVVPKGKWKVLLQREVDLLGEVRQVMD